MFLILETEYKLLILFLFVLLIGFQSQMAVSSYAEFKCCLLCEANAYKFEMLSLSRRIEHFWATLCLCIYFSVVRREGDLDSSSSWHASSYRVHRSEENECGRTDTYRPVFSFFIFHLTDWTETAEKSCCRMLPPSFMGCWALKTCTLAWRWPVADFKNITLINHLNPTTKTWAGVLKPVC